MTQNLDLLVVQENCEYVAKGWYGNTHLEFRAFSLEELQSLVIFGFKPLITRPVQVNFRLVPSSVIIMPATTF